MIVGIYSIHIYWVILVGFSKFDAMLKHEICTNFTLFHAIYALVVFNFVTVEMGVVENFNTINVVGLPE